MIDFEKLKLAHELCKQTKNYFFTTEFGGDDDLIFDLISMQIRDKAYEALTIDELIAKLQELNKPKSKYQVDQEVWFRDDKYITSFKISEIIYDDSGGNWYIHKHSDGVYVDCEGDFDQYNEIELYSSEQELIQAQIDYWSNLSPKDDSPKCPICKFSIFRDECINPNCDYMVTPPFEGEIKGFKKEYEHESDGMIYTSNPVKYKCKKCGEFYR